MDIFTITQTLFAIILVVLILLQQRGTGIGGAFGGDSSSYSTRRGAENFIFYGTIVMAFLFLGISVVRLLA